MTRVILHGCNGRMGRVVSGLAEEMEDIAIVAGVDVEGGPQGYPVFPSLEACCAQADVIIDFTSARAADHLLDYCGEKKMPLVLCTTGLEERQIAKVGKVSEKTAVLYSANMSLGVNMMLKLLQDAARVLVAAGFDVEIVEKHHNQKVDAPSGTAIALADSINGVLPEPYQYKYDRFARREKRGRKEIGISSVRGGSIVGEHDVIFAGTDEVVTFSHMAYSKAIFGKGALEAARFLAGRGPGIYSMADVVAAATARPGEGVSRGQ